MKTPEEQANELLEQDARSQGVSLRRLGIIDSRRQRTINEREIPMSDLWDVRRKRSSVLREDDFEDEEA